MNEAARPNPKLQRLQSLIGQWVTEGTHPYFPDRVFHGTATFEWLQGGAFLLMQTATEEPEIPSGLAVIGSDDATGEYFMLYFDERGVSRKYDVEVQSTNIVWSRTTPEFSQRFSLTVPGDARTMAGSGEMSRSGAPWEADLQLRYTRVADAPAGGA